MAKKNGEHEVAAIDTSAAAAVAEIVAGYSIDDYVAHGYSAEEAPIVEKLAAEIRQFNRSTVMSMLEVGGRLAQVRDQYKRGNWQFFVEYRCLLSAGTAQRYMAAHEVVRHNPLLGNVVENVNQSALYLLGHNKGVTPEIIELVVNEAQEGEVSRDRVKELLDAEKPKKAPKKDGKLGFKPLSKAKGTQARDQIEGIANTAWGTVASAGLNPAELNKNRAFKKFCNEVATGTSTNDLSRALHGFLMAAFVCDWSAQHGVDV